MSAHPPSYYSATALPAPARPPLAGPARCEVAVVGAGFTGLTAALLLAEGGRAVRVVERGAVGCGASGRNGGQIHTGHRVDQEELEALLGPAAARRLWQLSEEGKAFIRARIAAHAIACDLKPGLINAAWKPGHAPLLHDWARHLKETYGYAEMQVLSAAEIGAMIGSTRYHGGVLDRGGGHLHPLNYALGLAAAAEAAGAVIHEGTAVSAVQPHAGGYLLHTQGGALTAEAVILACDTALDALLPEAGARALPIMSYVVATAPLDAERAQALIRDDVAVADTKFVVDYYRLTADRRLLFGGGETYGANPPRDIAALVRKPLLRVFPQLADVPIDYAWGGAVGITLNRMPQAGHRAPGLYYAHGYSGQGVVWSGVMGRLMAEAILGNSADFELVAAVPVPRLPGGRWLRWPLQVLGMNWYALRDRL